MLTCPTPKNTLKGLSNEWNCCDLDWKLFKLRLWLIDALLKIKIEGEVRVTLWFIYSCFLCVFQQVEKVIKHRELEQKLADAKLEQATAILMEEKGKNQKEKELVSEGDVESGLRWGCFTYLVPSGKWKNLVCVIPLSFPDK